MSNGLQRHEWLLKVSNQDKLFFILGPCAMENESHTLMLAEQLKKMTEKLGVNLIFKASFDKANRLASGSYRSVGLDAGLAILSKVKEQLELPVITDVHETYQVAAVADVADVIQIPAMLCRQTDLLVAAGKTNKPIHLKKGQFMVAENMEHAAGKITETGNAHVWLCERGVSFGYQNLIVDPRNFPIMKSFGFPVVMDATHAVQHPGGKGMCSGGNRTFVPAIAATAVVQGIAGVFMEVHEEPERALSDGPNLVRLSQLEHLLRYLVDLDAWAKANPVPQIV